jgi:hypothetical protein
MIINSILCIVIILIVLIFREIRHRKLDYDNKDINIVNRLKYDIHLIRSNDDVTIEVGTNQMVLNKNHIILNIKNENGEYLEYPEILYNFLNMYSFTFCKSTGHTDEWLKIYRELLVKAEKLKIYKPPHNPFRA